MKRKLSLWAAVFFAAVGSAQAFVPVFVGDMVNRTVCYDDNYQIDLNNPIGFGVPQSIDQSAWQANYSSASFSSQTFNDGRVATGSITVAANSNFTAVKATNSITLGATAALAAQKATNSITVVTNSALSGAVITFNGALLIEGRDWTKTDTSTGTAVSIKTAINHFSPIQFSTGGAVVFGTATVAGIAGNNYTLASSTPAALAVGSAHFRGGREQALTNAVLTVNGVAYRAGYDFDVTDTSSGTATSIATLLNGISGLDAAAVSTVVYATAAVAGTAGNAFTLVASTPAAMVINQANFTGGRGTTTITINGIVLTNGVDWTTGVTSSNTAKSISDAIVANASLNTLITSTYTSSAIVFATATAVGTAGNLSLATNNSTSLTLSGAVMTGGTNSAYTVNTPTITIASNGFATGLGVLYSTGAASSSISGLTNQTTYYVGRIDANSFKLASSRSNATAGTFITLASSSTTGPHTFTLAPVTITGSPSFKWQQSNDASNWSDLSVSSVTLTTPYAATSTFWDLGVLNARYLRAKELGPTTGCWNLEILGNGKHAAP